MGANSASGRTLTGDQATMYANALTGGIDAAAGVNAGVSAGARRKLLSGNTTMTAVEVREGLRSGQ